MDPDSRRSGARVRPVRDRLRVLVSDGRGRGVRAGGLSRWLAGVAPARARGEVAVALVTDAHIRKLNSQFRRKDVPTDVLSFSAQSVSRLPAPGFRTPDPGSQTPDPGSRTADPILGDIVIATGVARRQARDAGHSYQTELRVLALHGLLHLLGYDHDTKTDRGRMARLEARLRRSGGLSVGLIERSDRRRRS